MATDLIQVFLVQSRESLERGVRLVRFPAHVTRARGRFMISFPDMPRLTVDPATRGDLARLAQQALYWNVERYLAMEESVPMPKDHRLPEGAELWLVALSEEHTRQVTRLWEIQKAGQHG